MNTIIKDTGVISEKLIAYLKAELKRPEIEYSSPLEQLQGGYETSTYRFKLKGVGEEISKFLVLRLYPQYYGIQNALWESAVQNVIAGEGYPVAKAYFVCTDMSVLGGAFFIMDFLSGQLLLSEPAETIPELMGKTQAKLHNIDPQTLIKRLKEQGVGEYSYSLNSRFDWLKDRANRLPWIREGVSWLIDNRPPEPRRLAICHGDFHALNILVDHGKISGVLDWPGFAIADPVFDVAITIMLTTIPAKHLTASMEGFSSVDWEVVADLYLSAYRSQKQLDSTNLDYYQVQRCVMALIQGFEGQKVWQHPLIVADLIVYINQKTGIQITVPSSLDFVQTGQSPV
jgi:aminoglycoside phosphotransferase (APT) family kinase protein